VALDWTTLRGLAEMSDDVGVLSLYATADPRDETSQPAWRVRARTELKRVREQARKAGPRAYAAAVNSRLDELDHDVEMMLDARTPGLGRALFAAIGNGNVERITLQVPLADHVALAASAQLRPLVNAWSAAGPAGCVAVAADEIRIIDLRLGLVSDVATIPHPEDLADRRELTGKGHATPATTHHSSTSHHDLFERREEDRMLRYLHSVGPMIATQVRQSGWECVVIAGEPKYVHAVTDGLPAGLSADVVKLPHTVTALTLPKLAGVVEPVLAEARAVRNLGLAERARDAALGANAEAGACGLAPTLAALQEGRVSHLLLAHDGEWSGNRAPDGTLLTEFEIPEGMQPSELTPEPRLDERMIEMAFHGGATITVLDDDAAKPLADTDGIGAILRW
jgi:hypothetical protein